MPIDPLDSQSHLGEGLRQNPKVNMSVVAAHEQLERELQNSVWRSSLVTTSNRLSAAYQAGLISVFI